MRALELIFYMILLVTVPVVFGATNVFPLSLGTCEPEVCGVQSWVLDTMNSTSLQQVSFDSTELLSWDNAKFALDFLAFSFFWIFFLLSAVVIIAPVLIIMFNVPTGLALWLSVGQWVLYMVAYIQLKRGGSLRDYR